MRRANKRVMLIMVGVALLAAANATLVPTAMEAAVLVRGLTSLQLTEPATRYISSVAHTDISSRLERPDARRIRDSSSICNL